MPATYETHRRQLELILKAWGMPEATAVGTAEIMICTASTHTAFR